MSWNKSVTSIGSSPIQLRLIACVCVAAFHSTSGGTATAAASQTSVEALTATLEYSFRPMQQVVARSSVVISELGLRVVDNVDDSNDHTEVSITNNKLQKYWLVDEQKAIVHEVPITILDNTTDITSIVLDFPGYIDTTPCLGAQGKLEGNIVYKGRTLESWSCTIDVVKAREEDELHLPARQYYSPDLGLVIYSLGHDQVEIELVDIENKMVEAALFMPAAHLRAVTIEEYSGVQALIDRYESQAQ